MSIRSDNRLNILRMLVLGLFLALIGRLFVLQIIEGAEFRNRAADLRIKEVVVPAPRGVIMDQAGRVLVSNRLSMVVSVSAPTLEAQPDGGKQILKRLAEILGTTPGRLADKLTICGRPGAAKAPTCWNGSPYQPIPVAQDLPVDVAVKILERRAQFPGVKAELQPERQIDEPLGVNLAHVLGYVGPVNDQELLQRKNTDQELQRTDLIGRSGLESFYDEWLRGSSGVTKVSINRASSVIGTVSKTAPRPGDYLVTGIDAALQRVVEDQLKAAIARAHSNGFKGDSGAAVVLDVTNGQVLALASYPTYDPRIWLGGISSKDYARLTASSANSPMVSRALQGLFPPASTFKVITTTAAARSKVPLGGTIYPCPSVIEIGNQKMHNHESHAYGNITVSRALEVSCNTVFYKIAYDMWLRDGGNRPSATAKDAVEKTAHSFGLGSRTGIDLPSEAKGRVGGRAYKLKQYETFKDIWCYRAKIGYPDVAKKDSVRAAYLKEIAKENCVDGGKYRGGDAANLAIGQGDTVVTPLQMANVYAAIANGGKLWQPRVVKAIISADGSKVAKIKPKLLSKVSFPAGERSYLLKSLRGVITDGTGRSPFAGWPQDKIAIAAKTGSGEMGAGKDPTSWFASFAPADHPRYVVVMMVSQGGTGALTSGPSVRKVWEAIFGVTGSTVDPTKAILLNSRPAAQLPTVGKDGSVSPIAGTTAVNKVLISRYGKGGA